MGLHRHSHQWTFGGLLSIVALAAAAIGCNPPPRVADPAEAKADAPTAGGAAAFVWVILGDLFASFADAVRTPGLVLFGGPLLFEVGLLVLLYRAAEYGTAAGAVRTTTTDAEGFFDFLDVDAPDNYIIEVRSAAGGTVLGASRPFTLAASEDATIDIEVAP